ncbi:hypothetical protein ACQJBY_072648 [Aegilops geniculata]
MAMSSVRPCPYMLTPAILVATGRQRPRLLRFVGLLPRATSVHAPLQARPLWCCSASAISTPTPVTVQQATPPDPLFSYNVWFFVWQARADSLSAIVTKIDATLIAHPHPPPSALACTGINVTSLLKSEDA